MFATAPEDVYQIRSIFTGSGLCSVFLGMVSCGFVSNNDVI